MPPHNQITSHPSPAQSQDTNKDFPFLHTLTQSSCEATNCLSELVSDVLSGLTHTLKFTQMKGDFVFFCCKKLMLNHHDILQFLRRYNTFFFNPQVVQCSTLILFNFSINQ
jgi:hypothetical protein